MILDYPKQKTLFILFLISLLMVIGVYHFSISPLLTELHQFKKKVGKIPLLSNSATPLFKPTPKEEVKQEITQHASLSKIITLLRAQQLTILTLRVVKIEKRRGITSLKIYLKVRGHFFKFFCLIAHLQRLNFPVFLHHFTIRKENSSTIVFQGNLLAYLYPLPIYHDVKLLMDAGHNPFDHLKDKFPLLFGVENINPPLSLLSIYQLHFIGTLLKEKQKKGLLQSSLGQIWQVKLEDRIGQENAKVVEIKTTGMLLQLNDPGKTLLLTLKSEEKT